MGILTWGPSKVVELERPEMRMDHSDVVDGPCFRNPVFHLKSVVIISV